MLIILEGPDGAGKSTMVQELALALWRAGRGTVLINPKRSPNQSVRMEYMIRLDFYRPRSGLDLILDRCWYSDDVYGPIWRGTGLEEGLRLELDSWADWRGAVVARLDTSDKVLADRLTARGDPDVTPEDIAIYAQRYREQAPSWGLETLLNPTVEELILRAEQRESVAKRAPLRQ